LRDGQRPPAELQLAEQSCEEFRVTFRAAVPDSHSNPLPDARSAAATTENLRVWDPLVRASHWIVVGLVVSLLLTGFTGDQDNHLALGVDVLVLVLVRIAWGFVDRGHAAFRNFVRTPRVVLDYGLSILRGNPERYLGHNPAGGWMVVALFLNLLALGLSGLFLQAELEYEGWLVGALGASDAAVLRMLWLHEAAVWSLLALIALHLVGVLVASRQHRENLVLAMITGDKPNLSPHQENQP
jgi:cytochrome b